MTNTKQHPSISIEPSYDGARESFEAVNGERGEILQPWEWDIAYQGFRHGWSKASAIYEASTISASLDGGALEVLRAEILALPYVTPFPDASSTKGELRTYRLGHRDGLRDAAQHVVAWNGRADRNPAETAQSDAPPQFAAWLAHQMPAGTVISSPAWWAPRIYRAAMLAAKESA